MKTILFLCTGNACRSQMAEGFARSMFPKDWQIYSAGTIAAGVHPLTIEVMQEVGIDISEQYSKTVKEIPIDKIDYLVTLCGNAKEKCPAFPRNVTKEHWPIADPLTTLPGWRRPLDMFRNTRDEIKAQIKNFLHRLET